MSYPANGPNWIDRNRRKTARGYDGRALGERTRGGGTRSTLPFSNAPSPSPMPQRMPDAKFDSGPADYLVLLGRAVRGAQIPRPLSGCEGLHSSRHTPSRHLSKSKAKKHHNTGVYCSTHCEPPDDRASRTITCKSIASDASAKYPLRLPSHPSHGVCNIGVALEDADQCIGMVDPSASIDEHGAIPPEYRALTRMGNGRDILSSLPQSIYSSTTCSGLPTSKRKYFAYQIAQIVNKFATSAPTRPYNPTNAELCGFEGPLTLGTQAASRAGL
ncbi:hypothetical protein C8F01DRAFT_1250249 [Mycena amicta]|nr:hypothetical protein C8F01DRAFT_1250249 [Mycena amicta]